MGCAKETGLREAVVLQLRVLPCRGRKTFHVVILLLPLLEGDTVTQVVAAARAQWDRRVALVMGRMALGPTLGPYYWRIAY